MEISGLAPKSHDPMPLAAKRAPGGAASFAELLGRLVSDVDRLQAEASGAMRGLAAGDVEDLHGVMIALNRADLSLRFLVEIRNRVLEAYQEISRMPV
jgi:flagellar hook-basal body complex protein FliE